MERATKKQLLTIALYEDCSLDLKWQAIAELEYRKWNDDYLIDLVRMWGQGKSSYEIAVKLDLPENTIKWQLEKHGLFGKGGRNAQKHKMRTVS